MYENFWKNLNPEEFSENLNFGIKLFCESYIKDSSLRFPSGLLPKIDDLREKYFPYLKNSQYKSNMCYLLHLLQYQLWLYKIFQPSYSLENSFFYQQLITLGIVAEALAYAILLNPCIAEDPRDNSLGQVKTEYQNLYKLVSRRNFSQNIEAIYILGTIDNSLREDFDSIRRDIRNYVHLQNWEGRLYESITQKLFQKKLDFFLNFLENLKEKIKMNFTVNDLEKVLNHESKENIVYFGEISYYNPEKGFGFIRSYEFSKNIFFHISKFLDDKKFLQKELPVIFNIEETEKGKQAINIRKAET